MTNNTTAKRKRQTKWLRNQFTEEKKRFGSTILFNACGYLKWSGMIISCWSTHNILYDSFEYTLGHMNQSSKKFGSYFLYAITYHFVLKMPNGVIRSHQSKTNRQYNSKKKNKNMTENDLLDTTQTQKQNIDWAPQSLLKISDDFRYSGMVSNFFSTSGTRGVTVKRLKYHVIWRLNGWMNRPWFLHGDLTLRGHFLICIFY